MGIIAKGSLSLFTAFALLNMVGYNAENGWRYGTVREKVRLKLSTRADYWRSILKGEGLLECILQAGGAQIMDLIPILSVGSEPAMLSKGIQHTAGWQEESRVNLTKIENLLQRFFTEENLELLWETFRSAVDEATVLFQKQENKLQSIASCFSYNAGVDSFDLILLPNLLDAHNRGYSVSMMPATFLFLGPVSSFQEAENLVVHELLHRWVDSEAERISAIKVFPNLMPQARAKFRMVADSYPDLSIWIGETVVRATTSWLTAEMPSTRFQNEDEMIVFYEQLGFIGFGKAYRHFNDSQNVPLDIILPEVIQIVGKTVEEWHGTILY